MYGARCVGVVLASLRQALELAYLLGVADGSDDDPRLLDIIRGVAINTMGYGVVVYFPSVQLGEGELAEDDDD